MARPSAYSYSPFRDDRSIRLLSFTGDRSSNASLVVKIDVVDLDTNPEHTTLSYCWGPPIFSAAIQCTNGSSNQSRVPAELAITRTLSCALKHLRGRGVQRLWCDQMCINQQDK